MKKKLRPPRFLTEVIKAIYELKEIGGSSSDKIVSHIKSNFKQIDSYATPRNLSTQVRRALKHATTNGIVKQRAGKYRLNKTILDPHKDCAECRRKKRMANRRRRKNRRGKKQALNSGVRSLSRQRSDSDCLRFGSDSDYTDEFPVRQLRRRRRGNRNGKKRSRRRRSGIRKRSIPTINKTSAMKVESVYPDDHKESNSNNECSPVQCDNPECLCNVKEEMEDNHSFNSPM